MTTPLMTSMWLAWRYLFAGRKRFAALITWTSVLGLALGVMVLTVVVSVMNGFDRELRTRLLGAIPHLVVQTPGQASAELLEQVKILAPGAKHAFHFFQAEGMVTQNGQVSPVSIYGLDDAGLAALTQPGEVFAQSGLATLAVASQADAGSVAVVPAEPQRDIVIGAPLARHLGLLRGDAVALVLSEPTPRGIKPTLLRFNLLDTFAIGAELDSSLAVIALKSLTPQERERLGRSGVRLDLQRPVQAESVAGVLRAGLEGVRIESWTESYGEFFRAVALEKTLMFLVLLLVVAVATFNIVSGQLMVVAEKQGDIAILRTMGASSRVIRRAFTVQGLLIAALGIVSGLALGVWVAANIAQLVSWLGEVTSYRLLQGTYFAALPTEIRASDLVVIGAIAGGLSLLAAFIPAARAADLNPVAALHGNG
ncbi:MAG: FtsX-like permease family protein [Pseudomonadales bacterium]